MNKLEDKVSGAVTEGLDKAEETATGMKVEAEAKVLGSKEKAKEYARKKAQ